VAIIRIQHIGMAVRDMHAACERLDKVFGLKCRDFRDDQGKGGRKDAPTVQYDSRMLLGNDCWLHIVQNWNPESRVCQFLEKHGEGLEHIALESDDIKADVQHLRDLGVPIYQDKIFDAADGFEAFVYPDQTPGLTVELIQPHDHSWAYPEDAGVVSDKMGLIRAQHIGLAVNDLKVACARFEELFGLKCQDFRDDQGRGGRKDIGVVQLDARILLGNECWLHVVQNSNPESRVNRFLKSHGEGLEHIALQTDSIEADVQYLRGIGVPIYQDKIFDAPDGFESFVYPDQTPGLTVELIQPHVTSWDYPAE
jgi:catechol 2,3-dioxygenase-like lactoylglutathione lyase family enzyme